MNDVQSPPLGAAQIAELRWVDGELARVDKARAWLVHRRMVLLAELAALSEPPGGTQSAPARPAQSGPASLAGSPDPAMALLELPAANSPGPRTELSARAVARLLLVAGAVLVVIAAAVFTVANWSSIGPLGRAAILLAVSAIMLTAPLPLSRRGLAATAESAGAIGLALTIGDAYLLIRLLHQHPGARPFDLAVLTAALTGAWAAYGRLSKLRGPWLAAIALAQVPGLYLADGLVRGIGGAGAPVAGPLACCLVVTAGADVLAGRRAEGAERRAEAMLTSLLAVTAWIAGLALATAVALTGPALASACWAAAAFAAAAAIGVVAWPKNAVLAPTVPLVAVLSGTALTGLASPVAVALPAAWRVVAFAGVSAAAVAGALALRAKASRAPAWAGAGIRLDLAAAGACAALAGTAWFVLPVTLRELSGPYPVTAAWAGQAARGPASSAEAWPALVVFTLLGLACWLAPVRRRAAARSIALGVTALAVACVPAAVSAAGWPRLAILTAGVAALAVAAIRTGAARHPAAHPEASQPAPEASTSSAAAPPEPGRPAPGLAWLPAAAALVLAASALGWSLSAASMTVAELAALTVIFAATSALARHAAGAVILTSAALASAAGLAFAAPLAAGWPARQAAYAVTGVAMIAVVAATSKKIRPVQALVLDLGAFAVVLAAAAAASQAGSFALVMALAALVASAAAWLRAGQRKSIALIATCVAIVVAVAAQLRPLAGAWLRPVSEPWHGHPLLGGGTGDGLAFAVAVLTICLAAGIAAAGAWRASRAPSLDALAIALPVIVVPASLAGDLGYQPVLACLLVLASGLTAWAALRGSLAPAAGAVVATLLALDWGLASPAATLIMLGCLAAAYALCAWRSARPYGRATFSSLTVLAGAVVVTAAVLAGGQPGWEAGVAVLGIAAAALLAAARLVSTAGNGTAGNSTAGNITALSLAVEAAGWLTALVGTAACLSRPATASLAIAVSGVICAGSALRRDRRPVLWAGLALLELAWCVWLASAGVAVIEAYTLPAGVIVTAFGWQAARRQPELRSWLAYGPGLALLLLPSLGAAWQDHGWIRPPLLGAGAGGVTLAGARRGLRAPLLTGAVVAALDAGRQLAPEVRRLAEALPGWVPIAVIGAVLLWAGATYEARLRNLTRLRRAMAKLR